MSSEDEPLPELPPGASSGAENDGNHGERIEDPEDQPAKTGLLKDEEVTATGIFKTFCKGDTWMDAQMFARSIERCRREIPSLRLVKSGLVREEYQNVATLDGLDLNAFLLTLRYLIRGHDRFEPKPAELLARMAAPHELAVEADRRVHQARKGVHSSHVIMDSESKHRLPQNMKVPHRGKSDAERLAYEGNSRHGAEKDHISQKDKKHYKAKQHLSSKHNATTTAKLAAAKEKRKAALKSHPKRGGFAVGPGAEAIGGSFQRKTVHSKKIEDLLEIGQWFGVADDNFGEVTYDTEHMEGKRIHVVDFLGDNAVDPNEEGRESVIKKTGPKTHAEGTFVTERHIALREYDRYIRKERRARRRKLDKALLDINDDDETMTKQSLGERHDFLAQKKFSFSRVAKTTSRDGDGDGDGDGGGAAESGEDLLAVGRHAAKGIPRRTQEAKDAEHVRDQLADLPLWEPWFIHGMTVTQLVVLCIMLFHSFGKDEFAKWGIRTTPTLCNPDLWGDCPTLFDGKTSDTTAARIESVNPWLGPDSAYLIRVASMFAPCMREDASVIKKAKDQACVECGPTSTQCKPFGGSATALTLTSGLEEGDASDETNRARERRVSETSVSQGERCWGCPAECAIPFEERPIEDRFTCCTLQYKRYGMMSIGDCYKNRGSPLYDMSNLALQNVSRLCDHPAEPVVLRPCCVGNTGTCHLYTKSQCVFHNGVFHETSQLCSEVACLGGTCAIYWNKNASTGAFFETDAWGDTAELSQNYPRNIIKNPNQWWRMIFSLGTHSGVVHFVLCMTLQWTIGCQIERTAGWLRVICIYFISGIGGYMVSGLFDPTNANTGSDPAVFGLLAVVCVELFQNWKLVQNPRWEATKLGFFMIVAFLLGTLPFVDNYSHLGGFIFGILSAMIFLPYITFGKWDFIRKRALLLIAIPVLFVLSILVMVGFYKIQNTDWCVGCHKFNCVEYHKDIKCGEHDGLASDNAFLLADTAISQLDGIS